MKFIYLTFLLLTTAIFSRAQDVPDVKAMINDQNTFLQHKLDEVEKRVDDLLWFQRVGDVAFVDKVFIAGPPRANVKNPTAMGANNPLKFWSYVFLPKNLNPDKKYPLMVLPHGGVHANFDTYYTHIIRELIYQGYIVVSAEYRGSTGYGEGTYNNIDYGGLEVDDSHASCEYMIENYDFVDKSRVGIMGWSHGGLITLMSIFDHPDTYKVAFAGVPVSDLVMRMGYYDNDYRDLYSAPNHIGKTANKNIEEYKRRSPVWSAGKLKTPLLIHTNTNDDDVNVVEVEHLIQALTFEKKDFQYEIFKDAPGGHSFDRIDIKNARQIRLKIYKFMNEKLNPQRPIKSLKDMEKAAYAPF